PIDLLHLSFPAPVNLSELPVSTNRITVIFHSRFDSNQGRELCKMVGANQQRASDDLSQSREHGDPAWSEGALRLVYENSPEAILIIREGVFIDCNRAAVEMFRATGKEAVLSFSLSQLSPADQPDG